MRADSAHPNPDIARRLERIYKLHRTEIDPRLGVDTPYNVLLEKLGNPHKHMPPAVHVAGTNGKGSTIAFMRAILEHAGYCVHVYTSPHLLTFNERIRLAGNIISDDELIALYDRVEAANAGASITFFEFTTAMAFVAFAQNPADIVLLETGMGGRLDCTNVIEHPLVTVITKISFDHTEFLGSTLPGIAHEKAGIIKPGVPCIIAPQMDMDAVLPVFEAQAEQQNAPLLIAGRDFPLTLPVMPNLVGAHQMENAICAAAASAVLAGKGFKITETDVNAGVTQAQWPARLQRVSHDPEIWFDAAHNDSGAQALAAQLAVWKKSDGKPIHLVVGLAADKDVHAFFSPMRGLYDSLTLVDLPQARKPQKAGELKLRAGLPDARVAESLSTALEALKTAPGRIVIAGSLYLYQSL